MTVLYIKFALRAAVFPVVQLWCVKKMQRLQQAIKIQFCETVKLNVTPIRFTATALTECALAHSFI